MEKLFEAIRNSFNSEEKETLEKIKEKPERMYLYRRLARSLNKREKVDEAIEVLEHTMEIEAGDWETILALSKIYEDSGKLDEAIALNKRGISVKPESPTPYDRLQRILVRSGRLEEAMAIYRDVPADSPMKEKSYDRLYRILIDKAKDTDRAMSVLQEAIGTFGPNMRRCKDLARLLFKKCKWEEAAEMFEKALSYKKDDTDILNYLAWCRIELEDYDEAVKYLREIIGIKPTLFSALIGLAELNLRRGNLDKAEEELTKLQRKYSDNSRIEICFAELALKRGDADGAITRCEEAIKKVANYYLWEQMHGHRVLGEAYRKKGNTAEADYHETLAKGLSRGPDAFKAIVSLIEEQIEKGDLKLAGRLAGRLIELYPKNTLGYIYRGEIEMREDRVKEAVESCKFGLQFADQRYLDEQVKGHRILVEAYKKLDKADEAARHEKKAALLEELAAI